VWAGVEDNNRDNWRLFIHWRRKRRRRRSHVMWVPVTMVWHILRLWMEETASRYGGWLQIY
jgi:hypothetical protein